MVMNFRTALSALPTRWSSIGEASCHVAWFWTSRSRSYMNTAQDMVSYANEIVLRLDFRLCQTHLQTKASLKSIFQFEQSLCFCMNACILFLFQTLIHFLSPFGFRSSPKRKCLVPKVQSLPSYTAWKQPSFCSHSAAHFSNDGQSGIAMPSA